MRKIQYESLMLNKKVKIDKRSKFWKIIGISYPLPELDGEVEYLITNNRKKMNISASKIIAVEL